MVILSPTSSSASPRTLTARRDRSLQSDGGGALAIAEVHGRPSLPWQRDAAMLLGERRPDGTARWPVAVIVVPRQVGKTTLMLDLALGRLLSRPGCRIAYAAQTGHQTTARMSDRMSEITLGPLAERFTLRRSQGTERITERRRGGFVRAFPPIADALRGDTLDCVILDEAQAHGEELGHALDATVLPTMTTRPGAQLIVIGTAGVLPGSEFLRRYVDRALTDPAALLIDYGASDGDDVDDPAVWERVHPGLAGGLTTLPYLESVKATNRAAFTREFLSVWATTQDAALPFLDLAAWEACADPTSHPADRTRWTWAVEISRERDRASIAVAATRPDGLVHVELVENRPGVGWVEPRLTELRARWGGSVRIDRSGPTATLAETPGAQPLSGPDAAAAHAMWRDAVAARKIRHRAQPALDDAAAAATIRMIGDRAVISRRSDVDVTPILAAALAGAAAVSNRSARPLVISSSSVA